MPEFAVILIHIIRCHDCKAHPEMEKHLATYEYFSNSEDQFSLNTLETLKRTISEITSRVHQDDMSVTSL